VNEESAKPPGPGSGPAFTPGPRGAPVDRVDRFRIWLQRYAEALETGDLESLDRLFAVQTSYQPGPFATLLNGRRAIRSYWEAVLEDRVGLSIRAEVLGAGGTHAVAHWRLTWRDGGADGAERVADGILIAALDAFGRCNSLREWSIQAVEGG
jgi:SnoaL-like domain